MINQNKSPCIFLLSGTPGTGKTSIAQHLFNQYQLKFLSLSDVIIQHNLYAAEDPKRDTKIIDEQKVHNFLTRYLLGLSEDLLIEGHYADIVNHPAISTAIILRCHPNKLGMRLESRGFSLPKRQENLEAEFLGDSTSFMLEKEELANSQRIFEIDTTSMTIAEAAELVYVILHHPEKYDAFRVGIISWLSDPSVDLTLWTTRL